MQKARCAALYKPLFPDIVVRLASWCIVCTRLACGCCCQKRRLPPCGISGRCQADVQALGCWLQCSGAAALGRVVVTLGAARIVCCLSSLLRNSTLPHVSICCSRISNCIRLSRQTYSLTLNPPSLPSPSAGHCADVLGAARAAPPRHRRKPGGGARSSRSRSRRGGAHAGVMPGLCSRAAAGWGRGCCAAHPATAEDFSRLPYQGLVCSASFRSLNLVSLPCQPFMDCSTPQPNLHTSSQCSIHGHHPRCMRWMGACPVACTATVSQRRTACRACTRSVPCTPPVTCKSRGVKRAVKRAADRNGGHVMCAELPAAKQAHLASGSGCQVLSIVAWQPAGCCGAFLQSITAPPAHADCFHCCVLSWHAWPREHGTWPQRTAGAAEQSLPHSRRVAHTGGGCLPLPHGSFAASRRGARALQGVHAAGLALTPMPPAAARCPEVSIPA